MTAVWELDLPDSDKLVLLALADCANDEGHCWPSVRYLTTKCSKSERTIQGSIKRLVDEGYLIRREVPGKGCNYTVLPRNAAPAVSAPRSDCAPQGTTQTPAESADKPSRTINSEAKASSQRVFEHWNGVAKEHGFIAATEFDASRRQIVRLRLKEYGEDRLKLAFDRMAGSAWLRGLGRDSKWKPDFDFALRPATIRKALEGSYGEDEKEKPSRRYEPTTPQDCERSAQFWESQGNASKAAEMRARALEMATPVGQFAQKILGGMAAHG